MSPLAAQNGQTPALPQSNLTEEVGALAKYQGQRVADVEFRGIAGTDPAMLRSLLEQKTNEPLDREKLRASLQALYATGRFATLQVEVEPAAPNSIDLVFDATENYFNGGVTVDGTPQKGGPKPNQLIAASQLDLGEVFAEEKVARSIDRMKKVLADNGYYQATITYKLEPNPETSQMAIHFHVVPGELARVGEVTIDGDTGIPPQQVRKLTKLKAGDKVKADHVTRALERLRAHYQKNAHLEAQVSSDRPALSLRQQPARLYLPGGRRSDRLHRHRRREDQQGPTQEAGPGVSGKLGGRRSAERRPAQSTRLPAN